MSFLAQLIHHYHDCIVLPSCSWKPCDEVHGYYLLTSTLEFIMVATIVSGTCVQILLVDTPSTLRCILQHFFSFSTNNTIVLLLLSSSHTQGDQHKVSYENQPLWGFSSMMNWVHIVYCYTLTTHLLWDGIPHTFSCLALISRFLLTD
jgi:hypothetical protein